MAINLILCVTYLSLLWFRTVSGQELIKTAEIVDDNSNPDIAGITFSVTLSIDVPDANLTSEITPWLEIQNIATSGSVVTRENNTITINFNSTITSGEVIATYNVTFRDSGVGFSGTLNWTSTLTYFTAIDGMIYTNTTEATVCFLKESKVVTREESRQWDIPVVLIVSLIVGFLVAFGILWLAQSLCGTVPGVNPAAVRDKKGDEEATKSSSSYSSNETDLANVIAADDARQSSRLLEFCEINDMCTAEDRLQWEKATRLQILLEFVAGSGGKHSKDEDSRSIKKEIQKMTDEATVETQLALKKEIESNAKSRTENREKQEKEIETLKQQVGSFSQEVQTELVSLAQERHELETTELEHVLNLRLKEVERRGNTTHDVKSKVLCQKLNACFSKQDHIYPSATKDAYTITIEKGQRLLGKESARSRNATASRKAEIAKMRAHEVAVRGKWNRFAQVLVDSVKTICRELQLEPDVRKSITAHVKDKMLEAKKFFDRQTTTERGEFLKECAVEKPKHLRTAKTEISTKGITDNPIDWATSQHKEMELEMEKVAENRGHYEKFVINLWKKKFDAVLKAMDEKLELLKNDVIQRLAQNGASKYSVEDFISRETRDNPAESQRTQDDPVFQADTREDDDKLQARDFVAQCHNEVLKIFLESQPFPTNKTPQKLMVDVNRVQQRPSKHSLNRIRDLIQFHTDSIQRNSKKPKNKLKKGFASFNEDSIRARLETQLEKWREEESFPRESSSSSNAAIQEFKNDVLTSEESLSTLLASELSNQMTKKSKLTLLHLDLNALERLMMTLLQSLVAERKLSPAECTVVLQQHKNQTAELQKSSTLRTRRRLEQVVRKRLHSPRPFSVDEDSNDAASTEVLHYLNATKNVERSAVRKIREDSEAAKEKFEILTQLNEQQASELRELDLKVMQALTKVANVSQSEMRACLALLLHHRDRDEIQNMLQTIFFGIKDEPKEKNFSGLLPAVRDMISQQKHRLAENLLKTDEDFAPTPLRSPNRLQRIKQPHRVTFLDDFSAARKDRLSPLPGIRPDPVGRTSSPDLESVADYQIHPSTVYSNFDQPLKPARRKKKKSLKNLSVAR